MASITVNPYNANYSSLDGVLFNKNQTALIECPGGKTGSYTVPSSVTSIGNSAFYYCLSLTGVTIPPEVTTINRNAFSSCPSLSAITVDPLNANYGSMDGALFNKAKTALIQCPEGKTGSFTIPPGVTSIESRAFSFCKKLKDVTIPPSVTSIADHAFSDCQGLTSITIPPGVTSIGSHAFHSCTGLTNVTISPGVTSIGAFAFYGCTGLTSIMIPVSLTRIEEGALDSCTGLTEITVEPNNSDFSSIDGVLYDKNQTTLILCPTDKTGSIRLPSNVKKISGTFYGRTKITAISADSLNTNYSGLDGVLYDRKQTTLIQCPEGKVGSVTIPSSVTNIGYSAFHSCTGLTSVTILPGVTSIADYAFIGCKGLTRIMIPASVISIGGNAFSGCTSLLEITVDPLNANYSISDGILFNKTQTNLIICPKNKSGSITIPSTVTVINEGAFHSCTGLTSITFPAGVTNIGNEAFYQCTSLTSANFMGNAPKILGGAFKETSKEFTVYYLNGKTGFTSPIWEGYKAVNKGDGK